MQSKVRVHPSWKFTKAMIEQDVEIHEKQRGKGVFEEK